MSGIILKAIRLAPCLFWQSLFQPTRINDFTSKNEKNVYIFICASFVSGFLVGICLAVPHYYLYKSLYQSVLFATATAIAFVFAFAFAIAFEFESENAAEISSLTRVVSGGASVVAVASAIGAVFADTFAFAVTVAGALVLVGAGALASTLASGIVNKSGRLPLFVLIFSTVLIALYLAVSVLLTPILVKRLLLLFTICWFIASLNFKNIINLSSFLELIFLLFSFLLILFIGLGGIHIVRTYELIMFPMSFMIGFYFKSSFEFITIRKEHRPYAEISPQRFRRVQKTILTAPLISCFFCLLVYFDAIPELSSKASIMALGFAAMPIFILHIPDYLFSIILWFFQLRKIVKNCKNSAKFLRAYENSLLFKHERIYFQLPCLYKILLILFKSQTLGVKETVKRIEHLYLYTFQQKQIQKTIVFLGKNKRTTHQYIHFLLQAKNFSLLKAFARTNLIAAFYLVLFEKTNQRQFKKKDDHGLSIALEKKFLIRRENFKERKYQIKGLEDRIKIVCQELKDEEGYRFNEETIKTLEIAHQYLTAYNLKDFYEGCELLEGKFGFPQEIAYFKGIQSLIPKLKKVKNDLQKIEAIDQYETKRSFLAQQKEYFETLSKTARENFYEPFQTIWEEALSHCAELMGQEIKLLQGSAVLSIELKNYEILASDEGRKLYFEIRNKGQELATNISMTLKSENPGIIFPSNFEDDIPIMESGTLKEISIPIFASTPLKVTIRGSVTFSDRYRESKKISFSFPITILEKKVEFKEMKNPYIAGPALKSDTSLFFGREDVFGFIDKNIMASGDFHSIVCHGLRRTGKSSLLNRIEEQGFTNKNLVPVKLDIQGIDDEKDFYSTLSNTIIEKLSLRSVSAAENFSQFKEFIKKIKPGLGKRIIVLMIDEFEELQMRVEEKRISMTIFSNIRHLMQHEEKLTFLFCGTHKLEEMSADYWSIFFNTALYRRISHLKRCDAVRLIKEPVNGQLTYDDLAVEQILKMTGGQPYLTQLICRTLVNDLNENKKRNDALIDDVDDAVERIISEGTDHFSRHIWDESSVLERLILSAAAEELTQKQLDHIGVDAVFDKIKLLLPDLSRKQSMETLERLVSKEILVEKNMRYCFPVNLLRKWIAARYPLRKVREEI